VFKYTSKQNKCKSCLNTTLSISNHQQHVSAMQAMDLVRNIRGIVLYIYPISYYDYVLSLKVAVIAETCCWWLLIDKVVLRLNLHLFYLQSKTVLFICRSDSCWFKTVFPSQDSADHLKGFRKEMWNKFITIFKYQKKFYIPLRYRGKFLSGSWQYWTME
jgi:hypothetical protein